MCQSIDVWHVQSVGGHVTVSGHMITFGHVTGHVTWKVQEDHVMCHMIGQVIASQGHVPASLDHVGESSSLLSGYSLALGLG